MTNIEKRVEIAKFVGWKKCDCGCDSWITPKGNIALASDVLLPAYESDLNFIHEVEILLDEKQGYNYFYHYLQPMFCGACWNKQAAMATAEQRAEALLKMLGKWKEDAMVVIEEKG